jgi:hypothetical protein
LDIGDLGKLGDRVSDIVKDATPKGYGLTTEVSFYTHGATQGPIGDLVSTGPYSLQKATGLVLDSKQITPEGWGNINWNFDSQNSIAAFYGCHTAGFAEKFFDYSNVAFTAGQGGSAGPSYSTKEFDKVGWLFRDLTKDIYYGSVESGNFIGVFGYARNQYEYIENSNERHRKEYYVAGNATIKNDKIIKDE